MDVPSQHSLFPASMVDIVDISCIEAIGIGQTECTLDELDLKMAAPRLQPQDITFVQPKQETPHPPVSVEGAVCPVSFLLPCDDQQYHYHDQQNTPRKDDWSKNPKPRNGDLVQYLQYQKYESQKT